MVNFGFSAFLKLLCLSDRQQRSEIRKRLNPRGQGYDFHRSLKRICRRYSDREINLEQALQLTNNISRIPERRSARRGVEAYARWLDDTPTFIIGDTATYVSPAEIFKLSFTPDFSLRLESRLTAIHIWNTANPDLIDRMAHAALHLAAEAYSDAESRPQDLAVLDLRSNVLIRLSEAIINFDTADAIAQRLERVFAEVEAERNERDDRLDHEPRIAPAR